MKKHLFYSLFITFILLALAETVRPGFVTNFFNMNLFFIVLILSGVISLQKEKKEVK